MGGKRLDSEWELDLTNPLADPYSELFPHSRSPLIRGKSSSAVDPQFA
jgi:hypothetical protein